MPQVHGRNSSFVLWDASGASQGVSPELNNSTLAWSRNNPDVTTYGKDTVHRLAGLRDYTLTCAGFWQSTGSGLIAIQTLISGSAISQFRWYPAGSTNTGCPSYTGCALLSAYQETGPVNGPVAVTFTLQAAAGSLTASAT